MASASDSTSARKLPAYLSVVPAPGGRFRKPRAVKPKPAPDPRMADLLRVAEIAEQVVERLARAVREGDHLAAIALADRATIDVRYATAMARNFVTP